MAAVPIYVWNGTAWQETGPTIPASPIKYQASAPSSPSTGDIWVDSDGDVTTGSQQFQRFRFVASGGETTISGNDANGATLAYTAGLEQVVLNGAVLVRGHDYTATNGTSITGLSPALVASDVLEVFSFIAFTVANTYTQSQVDGLLADYAGLRMITPTSVINATIGATGAVTFTSVGSVSFTLPSGYDNYKVLLNELTGSTTSINLNFRLRDSGGDISGSNYRWAYSRMFTGGTTPTGTGSGGDTSARILVMADGPLTSGELTLFNMSGTSVRPSYVSLAQSTDGVNGTYTYHGGNHYNATVTPTGFSLITSTGTMSGTVRIYGYKK